MFEMHTWFILLRLCIHIFVPKKNVCKLIEILLRNGRRLSLRILNTIPYMLFEFVWCDSCIHKSSWSIVNTCQKFNISGNVLMHNRYIICVKVFTALALQWLVFEIWHASGNVYFVFIFYWKKLSNIVQPIWQSN